MKYFHVVVLTFALFLVNIAPMRGQCRMAYNVSIYTDGSVSQDFSTLYGHANMIDNSTLCGCGHGSYQTTTTIYAPDGSHVFSTQSGYSANVVMPTNGLWGTFNVLGNGGLFCSCNGQVGAGGPNTPVYVPNPNCPTTIVKCRKHGVPTTGRPTEQLS